MVPDGAGMGAGMVPSWAGMVPALAGMVPAFSRHGFRHPIAYCSQHPILIDYTGADLFIVMSS
jgi:hypothetical protein